MVFPLEEVVKYTDNIYEMTVAASRRAFQLAKLNDPEIYTEENKGKVVSLGAKELFNQTVTYKIEEQAK